MSNNRQTTKNKTLQIVLVSIFAALYSSITLLFAPISFFAFQIRISEVLISFIPIFGWPVVIGLTIGTFLGNTISPLGLIDLVIGTFATFLGSLVIKKSKNPYVGFFLYAVIISVIIGWELSFVFFLPLEITIFEVFIGEFISAFLITSIFYGIIKKTFPDALNLTNGEVKK
ncbi:MAG: QueT transporter family protein [Candidatus Ranarchaeia archaeon]